MPSREDFKKIAIQRLKEAKILQSKGCFDTAFYLLGYVMETALKARICRILNTDYPNSGDITKAFHTHKIDQLIQLTGLHTEQQHKYNTNRTFRGNWDTLKIWTEVSRYNSVGTKTNIDIENFLNALEDKPDGILTWIKRKW